jgi:hypothetical protein
MTGLAFREVIVSQMSVWEDCPGADAATSPAPAPAEPVGAAAEI